MLQSRRISVGAYIVPLVGTMAVVATHYMLANYLGGLLTTLTFLFVVLASGATGGARSGVLVTVLSLIAYVFFFVEPALNLQISDWTAILRLSGYAAAGLAISLLCEGLRSAWDRVEDRQRQLETEIVERTQAESALKQAEQRKDEFLATLAHELRNPLAPLRNGVELLRLQQDGNGELRDVLSIMDRQIQQMVRLVDDLLEVSRITRGKLKLRREAIELNEAIRLALEAAEPLIKESQHELTVELPSEPIFVDADMTRLSQVFTNLLNNAAKYTQAGGKIWLVARREGDRALVSVRDNGIGIAAEDLDHVFEPFSQVTPALERAHGGLGIGLSLVRGLVEMHGGTVRADSGGDGMGTELVVSLPTHQPPAESRPEDIAIAPPTKQPSFRVLVADDNPDAVACLTMLLERLGHEVHTATDGADAIATAEKVQPRVALLDIGMPRMNGYEVARSIRRQPWGENMLLIATTGWGQEEDRRQAIEAGFDRHVTKPIELATLEQLLTTVPTAPIA